MNLEKFRQTQFERRTATVPVPELSDVLFDDGEKPELTVHSLTGHEVAKGQGKSPSKTNSINKLIEKIVSEKASTKVQGLQQALGLSDDVPDDLVHRIAICEFGVASDEIWSRKIA